jgi:hypothetical protein
MLLAVLEQARRYAFGLPPSQQVPVDLHHLPSEPAGLTYRRYARKRAMTSTDHLLRTQDLARRGQQNPTLKRRSLACWEFELLDVLLGSHLCDWLQYSCRHNDLVPVLLSDPHLQTLVRDCALEASRRPCLSDRDRERLIRLPDHKSVGYVACQDICRLFNDWQEAWKATTDYVCQWEQ